MAVFNVDAGAVAVDRRRAGAARDRRAADARLQPRLRRRAAALLHAVRRRCRAGGDARRGRRAAERRAHARASSTPTKDPLSRRPVRQRQRVAVRVVRGQRAHDRRVGRAAEDRRALVAVRATPTAPRAGASAAASRSRCTPATGRLYVLVHQGGADTHKAAGSEMWVYDVASHAARAAHPGAATRSASFLRGQSALGTERMRDRALRWALDHVLPNPGVERMLVTQDDDPVLLVVMSLIPPAVTVHDATTRRRAARGRRARAVGQRALRAVTAARWIPSSPSLRAALALLLRGRGGAQAARRAAFRATLDALPAAAGGAGRGRGACSAGARARDRAALATPCGVASARCLGALLLAVYALAMGVNLARGRRDLDCGCMGPARAAARSAAAASRATRCWSRAALAACCRCEPRALAWIDALTVPLAVGGARARSTRRSSACSAPAPTRAPALRAELALRRAAVTRRCWSRTGAVDRWCWSSRASWWRSHARSACSTSASHRSGALTLGRGPAVGERPPVVAATTLEARTLQIGAPSADGAQHAAVLPLAHLPGVQGAAAGAALRSRARSARGSTSCSPATAIPTSTQRCVRAQRRRRPALRGVAGARHDLAGAAVPYAVLLDAAGTIRSKGLVNTREHLESLLEADALGVGIAAGAARARARSRRPGGLRVTGVRDGIDRPHRERADARPRARDLAPQRARAPRRLAGRRRGAAAAAGRARRRRGAARRRRHRRATAGDPTQLRLLAQLRDRRLPVRVLRRHRERLPAGYRDVADHLDRHLPQPGRRQRLRGVVQRLLRARRCACAASACAPRARSRPT